jgi:hypothetical protein
MSLKIIIKQIKSLKIVILILSFFEGVINTLRVIAEFRKQ